MNVLFRASAGTGKTWQVSCLYTALVLGQPIETRGAGKRPARRHGGRGLEPIPPGRIVLMTFTDHAAAELRLRVTARVLDARRRAVEEKRSADADLAARVLRALPGAPIGTIHSFCADLLRERALQAGLSPAFAILDEDSAHQLLEEAARDELLARLDRGRAGRYDPDFEAFCQGMRALGSSRGTTVMQAAQSLLDQAASQGLDLAGAEGWLPAPRHAVTPADFAAILEELRRVRAERGGKLPPKAAAVFQCLEKNLKIFPNIGKKSADISNVWKDADLEKFAAALEAEADLSFQGAGLQELSGRLRDAVASVQQTALYRVREGAVRAFARFAAGVAAAYAARKRAVQGLDFDDLLIHTRDLLERDAAAAGRYDYLLLDEAQDTSRIQCDILRRLWDPKVNRLVLCGDTKQSIYAWRYADPRVMPDLEAAQRATKSFRSIALRTSFRSKDVILDAVNRLFAGVYGARYTADDMLAPAPERSGDTAARGEGPGFELIEPDAAGGEAEDAPDREARARAEMNSVAERIRLLVEGPADWQPRFRFNAAAGRFEEAGPLNRFRYADILILLRSTTRQPLLEQALHRYGIPYRVGGRGRGLFARQEATDLLLLLKALAHPRDTLALLGFLRSPWAGLSDEALLQLGWNGSGFDEAAFRRRALEGPLAGEPAAGPEDGERLASARALIRKYAGQVDRRAPSAIVRDAIRDTGFDAVLAATFRGEQRLANLEKLLAWIEQAERGRLAAELASEMEQLVAEPPDLPEAALLDPDQNVVTLMTIHGAKGLTAGVVIVPELGSKTRNSHAAALLESGADAGTGRLHVKAETVDRQEIATPGFGQAQEQADEVRKEEAKNLFYVALTRARDLVVLSGDPGSRKLSGWLADLRVFLADPEPSLVHRRTYGELRRATREAGLTADAAGRARPWPDGWPAPGPLFDSIAAAYAPAPGPLPTLRYPATLLSACLHDPAAFRAPPPAEREDDDDAAALGTAGHEMLEQAGQAGWGPSAEALATGPAAAALEPAARRELLARAQRAAIRMKEEARGWDVATEWPFALKLEGGGATVIVDGTADLVLARAGRRRVVDYKFSEEDAAALAARYGLQLNLYRLAVARQAGVAPASVEASILAVRCEGVELVDIPFDPATAARAVAAARECYRSSRGAREGADQGAACAARTAAE
ncbi:MAG TPA: UvrD-helicase domain-containing protein [Kiritimatiellia bacterium]|nr:UvrD-helicase domain-containing protein [Kiritimatiellia bacterium]HRZ11134.1 UvrD-helicase domain-containing protein [Kiritimatiellia bacterium]HSA19494.1 UvrD-helicase domain-containing protein [Kiritimatiellia bacterium]